MYSFCITFFIFTIPLFLANCALYLFCAQLANTMRWVELKIYKDFQVRPAFIVMWRAIIVITVPAVMRNFFIVFF